MPKKSTKTILAALKKAGAELGDDPDKVTEALDDLELSAEEHLGPDQIVLTKDEHRELKDDLTALRKRAKSAEGEAKDLREAMDAGDSDNVRKATSYKKKLDELQPLVDTLVKSQSDAWAANEKTIPKELRAEFTFAEEGKEITTGEMLSNVKKFNEYKRIGALTGEVPEGDPQEPPTAPKIPGSTTPSKLTTEQMDKMSPGSMMDAGYGSMTKT